MVQVCLWGPRVKMDSYESGWLEKHVTEGLLVRLVSADAIYLGIGRVPLFSVVQPVFASLK